MLVKKLPTATITLGDATISLSAKLCTNIGNAAHTTASKVLSRIQRSKSPNTLDDLELAHRGLDAIDEALPQLEAHVAQLRGVLALMDGKATTTTGPAIDNTSMVMSLLASLQAADPTLDFELDELTEARTSITDCVKTLSASVTALKAKRDKVDTLCRESVLHAVASVKLPPPLERNVLAVSEDGYPGVQIERSVNISAVTAILSKYELPIQHVELKDLTAPLEIHAAAQHVVTQQRKTVLTSKAKDAAEKRLSIETEIGEVWAA